MLAAVRATDERLIAAWYSMQIFAHLAFFYTKLVLLTSYNTCCHTPDASQSECDLHEIFWPTKNVMMTRCLIQDNVHANVTVFSVHKWCHNDIIFIKLTVSGFFAPLPVCPLACSPHGFFAPSLICPLAHLLPGLFAPWLIHSLACSPPGSFAACSWLIRPLACLLSGLFAPWLFCPLTLDVLPSLNASNSTSRFIRNNCP